MAVSGAQAVTSYLSESPGNVISKPARGSGGSGPPAGTAAEPKKLVLGFLAERGPSHTVDLLAALAGGSPERPLSTIAIAVEDLVDEGALEERGNGIVGVAGDRRDVPPD